SMRWRRSGRRPRSIPTSLEPLETRPVFRAQLDLEGQLVSLGALFQHLAARVEPGDACPVAGVHTHAMGLGPLVQKMSDGFAQRIDPFPMQSRNRDDVGPAVSFSDQL